LDRASVVGVFFSLNGFGKVLCYNPSLWNQALHEVPWFSAVPQGLFIFIPIDFFTSLRVYPAYFAGFFGT
jgi:hypothetical protein